MQVIALDMDSTLNNLDEVWYGRYNKIMGDDLSSKDVKSWSTHKYAKHGHAVYDFLDNNTFARLYPLPYAVEVTRELVKHNEIVVVSAVHGDTYGVKEKWLREYFPHLKHIIFTSSKWLVRADVLIDDGVHNLESFPRRAICFNQPWNQDWTGERVFNWQEVPAVLGG